MISCFAVVVILSDIIILGQQRTIGKQQTATQARQLAALREKFAAFPALGTELVPQNSMLREFIGK